MINVVDSILFQLNYKVQFILICHKYHHNIHVLENRVCHSKLAQSNHLQIQLSAPVLSPVPPQTIQQTSGSWVRISSIVSSLEANLLRWFLVCSYQFGLTLNDCFQSRSEGRVNGDVNPSKYLSFPYSFTPYQ